MNSVAGVNLPAWVDILLVVSLVCGAIMGIVKFVRKGLMPIVRMAVTFETVWPVLVSIAKLFTANGTPTLTQQVKIIDDRSARMGEELRKVSMKLDELHEYTHVNKHELSNQLTNVILRLDTIERTAALNVGHIRADIESAYSDIRTGNDLSLGVLGVRTESRRVDELEPGDRTEEEAQHLRTFPVQHPPTEGQKGDSNETGVHDD